MEGVRLKKTVSYVLQKWRRLQRLIRAALNYRITRVNLILPGDCFFHLICTNPKPCFTSRQNIHSKLWLHKTFLFPQSTCCIFHLGGSERPDPEDCAFQNCHFAHFHHTAAVRANTRRESSCIGIHRAPCQPRVPSAYRQQRPFTLSLTRSLKYQAEVTHSGLMLILTIMTKDGTLNMPHIAKLNTILPERGMRECQRQLDVTLCLWGLSEDRVNPQ